MNSYYRNLRKFSHWSQKIFNDLQNVKKCYSCPVRFLSNSSLKMSSSPIINERYRGIPERNVWVEYSALAIAHNAVNLGQGFQDYPVPDYIREPLDEVSQSENAMIHQYTRSFGHLRLVKALSNLYSKLMSREIDAMNNILVTVGAYGSLFCAIQGQLHAGDEAIIIEPFFDCYAPMVKIAGGVSKFVPLRPRKSGVKLSSADWVLDPDELREAFTDRTKLFILNTPNNPLGKVFTREELQMIADLCIQHDVICISDEVYEWLVYPGFEHIRIATFPGMWDRTITIGSVGKTFSVTGWKLGWSIAPLNLLRPSQVVHQNCIYTCSTALQEATAINFERETARLGQPGSYWSDLQHELLEQRDKLVDILERTGFTVTVPEGGYFLLADWSKLPIRDKILKYKDESSRPDEPHDAKFAKYMTINHQLATIPPSAFYCFEHEHLAEDYIRFCFFKKDETFKKAEEILKNCQIEK